LEEACYKLTSIDAKNAEVAFCLQDICLYLIDEKDNYSFSGCVLFGWEGAIFADHLPDNSNSNHSNVMLRGRGSGCF
jgi:hypothetical protein